jgi:hypothetical protein
MLISKRRENFARQIVCSRGAKFVGALEIFETSARPAVFENFSPAVVGGSERWLDPNTGPTVTAL